MLFAVNILFALIWAGLVGTIDLSSLVTGFVLGYGCIFLVYRQQPAGAAYFGKAPKVVAFVIYYLFELVKSNIVIAVDILSPKYRIRPGVIAIPLDARTDVEITLFANLISMTPGTLSLDISEDRKTLFVHAMYIDNAETLRTETKDQLERRVLEILR